MAGASQQSRPDQSSVITPRSVAALVGGACLAALAWAAAESGGSVPAEGVTPPNPVGLALMALGLLAVGAGVALRFRGPASNDVNRRHEVTIDETEVRALLERWYPEWDGRHRARVAAAIAYHRRRRGAG